MRFIREALCGFLKKENVSQTWTKPFNENFAMVFASLAMLERDGEKARVTDDFLWEQSNIEYLENLGDVWTTFRQKQDPLFRKIFPLVLEEYRNAKQINHLRVSDTLPVTQRRLKERQNELTGLLNPLLEKMAREMMTIGINEEQLIKMGGSKGLNFTTKK